MWVRFWRRMQSTATTIQTRLNRETVASVRLMKPVHGGRWISVQLCLFSVSFWPTEEIAVVILYRSLSFLVNANSRSRSLYSIAHPSDVCRMFVVCLSVCNVRAPYSAGWNFRQYFYVILVPCIYHATRRDYGHVTHFKLWGPNDIFGTARIVKFRLHSGRLYHILAYGWQTTPKKGVVRGHMTRFQCRCPQLYLRNGWSEYRQIFVCRSIISSVGLGMTLLGLPYSGRGQGHVTCFFKFCPNHIFGIANYLCISNVVCCLIHYRSTSACMIYYPKSDMFRVTWPF